MTYNNLHTVVRGVIIQDDCILLCKTCQPENNFYFLPGGHIEYQESAKSALKRELIEEGNLKIEITRFLGVFENYFTPKEPYPYCHNHEYNLIFQADIVEYHDVFIPIKQIEEGVKLIWIPIAQLTEIDFRPELLRDALLKWLNDDTCDVFETTM